MPRKKDRFILFGVGGVSKEEISEELLEEVKITFRAPRILREKVKEFVRKNDFSSENRVYEEATWKYISNYDYAQIVSNAISEKTKEVFNELVHLHQSEFEDVFNSFKKMVRDLEKLVLPLKESEKRILSAQEKMFEKSRYVLINWIIWLVANGFSKKEAIIKTLSEMSDAPRWLIEDSLRLCEDEGLITKNSNDEYAVSKISDVGLRKLRII